jgi:Zn-dependent peptidase ImmA (M78 family)/DNA-binding XRE family transcriptional regulator
MSKSATLYVDVTPSVLKWLRESIGYDKIDVSKLLDIHPDTITHWENGEKKPTFENILDLADLYKRPVSAFYLSQPMKEPALPKDYRRFSLKESKISPNDHYLIRKTQYLHEISNELLKDLDEDTNPQINNVYLTDDPEYVARYERSVAKISIDEQKGWKDHWTAFRSLKKIIESKNILIFQFSFDKRNIRGFVLKDMKPYTIVLNSSTNDHISARVFTLLHEYAHILLNESKSALCYPGDAPIVENNKDAVMERWCDNFAGCFLMPKEQFVNDFSSDLRYDRIRWLSNKYKVSKLAVLTRLYVLEEISWPQYEAQRNIITQKDFKIDETSGGGGKIPSKITIRERGQKFCSLVLESNRRNLITTNEALEFLDLKLSNINELKKELA